MKCVNHPEADATGYCRQCGKALCGTCRRDVRGVVYCEDCLAVDVLGGAPGGPAVPSPGLALALGFIPGVGAIYNGEYAKGLIHIFIIGLLISSFDSPIGRGIEPLLGLLLAFFWFVYMPMDAYRTAKQRLAGKAPASGWESLGLGGGKAAPIGPLILIVLGVLFLFNTLDVFHFFRPAWRFFWPAALIAVGVWWLLKRTGGDSGQRGEGQ